VFGFKLYLGCKNKKPSHLITFLIRNELTFQKNSLLETLNLRRHYEKNVTVGIHEPFSNECGACGSSEY
jgi:hypothetical protein